MRPNYNRQLVIVVLILSVIFPNPPLLLADDSFRIAIFPRRSVAQTEKMFTPLAKYLEQQLGRQVLLEVPPDMPAFWSRMEEGSYDMVHLNQYHYVRAHAKLGWQAILKNEEFGEDAIAAGLWVLKESDINQLSDLRGKLIVFGGGDHAMVASIMTRDILQQAGIEDDMYIGMSTLHPIHSINSVYYKQADAAGVGVTVVKIPAIKSKIDTDKLRVLAKSKSLAHLPWAIRGDIDTNMKENVIQSLLLLNDSFSGQKILNSAGLTGIRSVQDSDYDDHRVIIKRVLNEEY